MGICYLISIICTYFILSHLKQKGDKLIDEKGYEENPARKSFKYHLEDYLYDAFYLLLPFANIAFALTVLIFEDEMLPDVVDDMIKNDKLVKKKDKQEDDINKAEERLIIDNILASKKLQEDKPKWKKTISSMYYALGNLLKKHNIIDEEEYKTESIVEDTVKVKTYINSRGKTW